MADIASERACEESNVEPRHERFGGTDAEALEYVLDLNVKRRHLNESQRAMVAAELANLGEGRPVRTAHNCAVSQERAGALLNVSRRSVQHATEVRDHAIPAIAAAVRGGAIPVSQAAQVARLPETQQQVVAASLGDGRSVATIVLGATRAHRAAVIERESLAFPLSALGRTFPVLYADPPWAFEASSEGGMLKSGEMHYPTMRADEIAALPVGEIAARDAVLFLWAVPAMFPEALGVVAAWGFTFKTFAVWVKPHIACGHWFRGQHEPLIVATRGNMPPPSPSDLHAGVFEGEASGVHSSKPDCVRNWISAAYPGVGKIELFARGPVPADWFPWGHQAVVA
jgi:N6-adenosine-specific RNA methylase IME4